ncbi:hypothetical protein G7046_g4340 [Stylonectria norvegica]|nr:hypothetical protein G7046_g4340 [Stylonectria norvegica]
MGTGDGALFVREGFVGERKLKCPGGILGVADGGDELGEDVWRCSKGGQKGGQLGVSFGSGAGLDKSRGGFEGVFTYLVAL